MEQVDNVEVGDSPGPQKSLMSKGADTHCDFLLYDPGDRGLGGCFSWTELRWGQVSALRHGACRRRDLSPTGDVLHVLYL